MPLPQEERYTLADALDWPEKLRIELIEGKPVMITPAEKNSSSNFYRAGCPTL